MDSRQIEGTQERGECRQLLGETNRNQKNIVDLTVC